MNTDFGILLAYEMRLSRICKLKVVVFLNRSRTVPGAVFRGSSCSSVQQQLQQQQQQQLQGN
jgi:hypothetical protein